MAKRLKIKQVHMDRDIQQVSSIFGSPAKDWKYTDKAGHGHSYVAGGYIYPSLDVVYEGCGDADHDIDCEGPSHYECKLCKERISPGISYLPEFIEGLTTYTLVLTGKNEEYTVVLSDFHLKNIPVTNMTVKYDDVEPFFTERRFWK